MGSCGRANALVQMLNPGKCHTFTDFASTTLYHTYIKSNLSTVQRLDLVRDQYFCGIASKLPHVQKEEVESGVAFRQRH